MQLIHTNKHLLKSKLYKQLTDFKIYIYIYIYIYIINTNKVIYARDGDYLTYLLYTMNWPS